jgi:predicted ArsR family transcriptional regulator
MPVLARMVLAMAARLQASGTDAEAVGRTEGASRARPYQQAPSTLEALVSDLDRLGFDPVVTDAGADPDVAMVAFTHCPFAELAEAHPELVCGLHRGLVAGFVAEMGDAEVDEFCTLTSRTPCRVTVASR